MKPIDILLLIAVAAMVYGAVRMLQSGKHHGCCGGGSDGSSCGGGCGDCIGCGKQKEQKEK